MFEIVDGNIFGLTNFTETFASSGWPYAEEWINEASESCLSLEILNPKTNNIASNILDFPFPFGPIIQVKWSLKGPMICFPK